MPELLVTVYEIVVFQSQLNFEATAEASILKLSGTNCSWRLSSCCVTWAHAGETQDSETSPRMGVTIRSMASPPSVPLGYRQFLSVEPVKGRSMKASLA